MSSSIDTAEIKKFSFNSDQWWDERGPYRLLHHINPVRLQYIQSQMIKKGLIHLQSGDAEGMSGSFEHTTKQSSIVESKYGTSINTKKSFIENNQPYRDLSIIDIGCGGGIVCEPLARLGAAVTGIDAVEGNIKTAMSHAEQGNLDIQYHCTTVEEWGKQSPKYDVVIVFELIEHVDSWEFFLINCLQLLKPNGLLVLSTLNRTIKSYLLSIVAAEYILRWVPRGTHEWQKFLKPSEIAQILTDNGCHLQNISGLEYICWKDQWQLGASNDVNYFLTASIQNF